MVLSEWILPIHLKLDPGQDPVEGKLGVLFINLEGMPPLPPLPWLLGHLPLMEPGSDRVSQPSRRYPSPRPPSVFDRFRMTNRKKYYSCGKQFVQFLLYQWFQVRVHLSKFMLKRLYILFHRNDMLDYPRIISLQIVRRMSTQIHLSIA